MDFNKLPSTKIEGHSWQDFFARLYVCLLTLHIYRQTLHNFR